MDPFTLFAIASGAVKAVKQGCQLYKEIKGVAGDVKGVIKDLEEQFFKKYPGGRAPKEAIKQFNDEKTRVKELGNKDHNDIYHEIGEQLGAYYENYAKCRAIFAAEEKRAKEVYTGGESLGKRALQRVLMRKKLEEMGKELREVMVYQSPTELGALYTEVSEMMEKMVEEQEAAVEKQMQENERLRRIKKKKVDRWITNALFGLAAIITSSFVGLCFALLVQDRIEKYPHLGSEWIPKGPKQRQLEAQPYKYIGR